MRTRSSSIAVKEAKEDGAEGRDGAREGIRERETEGRPIDSSEGERGRRGEWEA